MFDYRDITIPFHNYVVDSEGDCWTDSVFEHVARNVARKLAQSERMTFYVYNHTGVIFTAQS